MNTMHNSYPAQIAYRIADAALDAANADYRTADAALDANPYSPGIAYRFADAALDEANADYEASAKLLNAAWSAEYQAGTALIEWAWSIQQAMPNAEQVKPAVEAALEADCAWPNWSKSANTRRFVIGRALLLAA
jgi:hypothetical protein